MPSLASEVRVRVMLAGRSQAGGSDRQLSGWCRASAAKGAGWAGLWSEMIFPRNPMLEVSA